MHSSMEIAKSINEGNVAISLRVIYSKETSMHLCKYIATRMLIKELYIMLKNKNTYKSTNRKNN